MKIDVSTFACRGWRLPFVNTQTLSPFRTRSGIMNWHRPAEMTIHVYTWDGAAQCERGSGLQFALQSRYLLETLEC